MPVKEPRWITGCMGSFGIRLAPFAKVTRAQWRRALKEARREALLSAAESANDCAARIRTASEKMAEQGYIDVYQKGCKEADLWQETALWLKARAEAKAST